MRHIHSLLRSPSAAHLLQAMFGRTDPMYVVMATKKA